MHKYIKGDKMEQNATATMPVMDSGKQNSGKGLKIATAIASVAAVCGIGFGVYGMVQSSQKDNQISDLKVQIKEDDGTVTTIETPEINTTTDNGTTITIADSATKNENPEEYIYIGQWGVKLKKPENWRSLAQQYTYYNDYPQAVDTFEIVENESIATSHAMISPSNNNCQDDEWTNCISIDLGGDTTAIDIRVPNEGSSSISEDFRNWVTNPNNYSAI